MIDFGVNLEFELFGLLLTVLEVGAIFFVLAAVILSVFSVL